MLSCRYKTQLKTFVLAFILVLILGYQLPSFCVVKLLDNSFFLRKYLEVFLYGAQI